MATDLLSRPAPRPLRIALTVLAVYVVMAVVASMMARPAQLEPEKAYRYISKRASEAGIDPDFVYAIAWAESSLRPHARTGVARGLMQLGRAAWQDVSDRPYRQAWNWKRNVDVAVEYLAYCRRRLEQADAFSYPVLAAAYRYGPGYVARLDYDISRMKSPRNLIYAELLAGDRRPVPPPE